MPDGMENRVAQLDIAFVTLPRRLDDGQMVCPQGQRFRNASDRRSPGYDVVLGAVKSHEWNRTEVVIHRGGLQYSLLNESVQIRDVGIQHLQVFRLRVWTDTKN